MTLATTAVIGLGKLGLPLALLLADSGFSVRCFDADAALMDALRRGSTGLCEPGVDALLGRHADQLTLVDDVAAAVSGSAAVFIVAPTPSDAQGRFRSDIVSAIAADIGSAIHGGGDAPVVVVVSTTMPGDMEQHVMPALCAAAGQPVHLCYCPEFVALGSVLRDMRQPDFVLIGESDPHAGDALLAIVERLWDARPRIARMNFINAELTKLAVNTMITARISAANQMSELCERLPGADAATVMSAVGLDRRIGPSCLKPATGFGGPCFPRDNAALIALGSGVGVSMDMAVATQAINARQAARVVQRVKSLCPAGTVAVLGLSYKDSTNICDASAGVAIANGLIDAGYAVRAHDPLAQEPQPLAQGVELVSTVAACLSGADAAVITVPHPDYAALTEADLATITVLDCWDILPPMPRLHRLSMAATAQ